jgi:hypothetical protein
MGLLYLCEQLGSTATASPVTGEWRIPLDEDLYDVYCSPKISLVIKSIRMRWWDHEVKCVSLMRKMSIWLKVRKSCISFLC